MASKHWTQDDLADLTGRTVVVTGASSGIGLVAARELGRHGARVILAVRDVAKGRDVAQDFVGDYEVRELNLADLESVRAFAAEWRGDLDVLINNAGIMMAPAFRTPDDFELHFGTNHLGPFALTNLLLPHVTDRVVTVSSILHRRGRIHLEDLHFDVRPYVAMTAYQDSKLANLLFTLRVAAPADGAGERGAGGGGPSGDRADESGRARARRQRPREHALPATLQHRGEGSPAAALRGHAGHPRRQLRRPGRVRARARLPGHPRNREARDGY